MNFSFDTRFMKIEKFIILMLIVIPVFSKSQTITYSDPEKNHTKYDNTEVIGNVADNFFVIKLIKEKYLLQILNTELKLKEKIILNFLPSEIYCLNFTFLLESGRQVDKTTMIIPCRKNNNIALTMIHFV